MGIRWITFFSAVMWLLPFGVPFLVVLGCHGLCLEVLLIYLIVSGPMAGLGLMQCKKWCLCASSGVYGKKGMICTLRVEKGHWWFLLYASST
jgi:hypothetical protein